MIEEFKEMGAGNLEAELREVEQLDENSDRTVYSSFTVGCSAVLTLICC